MYPKIQDSWVQIEAFASSLTYLAASENIWDGRN